MEQGHGGTRAALDLVKSVDWMTLAVAGVAGIDCPAKEGGAFVDRSTASRAREPRIDPVVYLGTTAPAFFVQTGHRVRQEQRHIITASTETNV